MPSRLNGENIAGAAFLFFSSLFFAAGTADPVFESLYPVDYLLAAIGAALLLLGYRTWLIERRHAAAREPGVLLMEA